jgi:hypothetical protein
VQYELAEIPSGLRGTDATVEKIFHLVRQDLLNPELRLFATDILNRAGTRSKAHLAEVRALFRYVGHNIRYQKDPVGIETVQAPLVTLKIGAGDCDDLSGLLIGLALSIGVSIRVRVVGYSKDDFTHIWPEFFVEGKWWPADATEFNRGFGWRPPRFPVEKTYTLKEGGDMQLSQVVAPELMLRRGDLKRAIIAEVTGVLRQNWQRGLINLADVQGYLRVIREGNFPARSPLLVGPTEIAISAFIDTVVENRWGSLKPQGTRSGLEGLDGFLSSVWKGVKKAVKTVGGAALSVVPGGGIIKGAVTAAVGLIRGGQAPAVAQPSGPLFQVSPTVRVPAGAVTAAIQPGVAQAFGVGMGGSMLPWIIGGGLGLLLILGVGRK